jgi:DNA-binding response OmpR family regulator
MSELNPTPMDNETLRSGDVEQDAGRRKVQEMRRTVLLVEDDPANREALLEMLSLWGYDVLPVGTAEEAEFAIRNKHPDAAVIDVFLPGKSGTALMSRLRSRFPNAILIGMSALGDADMSRRCKGLGADVFIEKPVDLSRLADALRSRHVSWH